MRRVLAICRHGDRSPAFNALSGSPHQAAHLEDWQRRVVDSSAKGLSRFPVRNANAATFDNGKFPLQWLTQLGWEQAKARGQALKRDFPDLFPPPPPSAATVPPFIRCRASNYVRTQLTAAAVLEGLLGDASGPAEVPIEVREAAGDNISVFESGRGLTEAMSEVTNSAAYKAKEKQMLHISSRLINSVPFFMPAEEEDVTGNSAATALTSQPSLLKESLSASADATPSKSVTFQWIRALDLFHAFRAHSLPFPPGLASEAELHKLELLTSEHLLWRFRTLFSIPHALALATAGLLGEASELFASSFPQKGSAGVEDQKPLFTLLSGHDVTLLPLLYALVPLSTPDAVTAAAKATPSAASSAVGVFARYASAPDRWVQIDSRQKAMTEVPWPCYTSALVFEQSKSEPRVLIWRYSHEVGGGMKEAPKAEKQRTVIHTRLIETLLAAGPTPRSALPFADNRGNPHPSYLSPDAELSEEDAASIIASAGKDAAQAIPSHLRHRLRVDDKGIARPDDVLEMTGAVLLEDLKAFAAILKEIEGPAVRKYAPKV